MNILIIVDSLSGWPLRIPGVLLVSARAYLTDPAYSVGPPVKIFNLCKSFRYQSLGYYVSLLAEARGHKPLPAVRTIEDLHSRPLIRYLTKGLDALIQDLLAPLKSDDFELSIYFGRNVTHSYGELSLHLFNLLQAPLLGAYFKRKHNKWHLRSIRPIAACDIPNHHQEFAVQAATTYFIGCKQRTKTSLSPRFGLAILYDPSNPEQPSNGKALRKFAEAAEDLGMRLEFIDRADIGRLREFDALFIRDTTFVNHYTYRFSRRAMAEGLVVIDAPDSILKCNNKVYLAELFARHNISTPMTLLVHRDNIHVIVPTLGLPCVLKQPDSSFSRGVVKVETQIELFARVRELLSKSALIIAQQWLPTEFDWRVGIIDRRVLFVAKYFFPPGHWQIIKRDEQQHKLSEGATLAIPVDETPEEVIRVALKSANLIGDGFYGVDIKQVDNHCYVIEINDNPNVDAGNEDGELKDALYREVMGVFLRRIEEHKLGSS